MTRGASASGPEGAAARSAALSPWISTDDAGGELAGRTSPATASPATTRPASTRTAANEMTSSVRGSSPVVSTSTTANGASRQCVRPACLNSAPAFAARRDRGAPPHSAKGLLERSGVSGASRLGSIRPSGALPSRSRDLVLHPQRAYQLEGVAQDGFLVASRVHGLRAASSRAGVEAAVTPAARPPQRASDSIGSSPPCSMSSTPLRSPLEWSTKSRRKPVGGRLARPRPAGAEHQPALVEGAARRRAARPRWSDPTRDRSPPSPRAASARGRDRAPRPRRGPPPPRHSTERANSRLEATAP